MTSVCPVRARGRVLLAFVCVGIVSLAGSESLAQLAAAPIPKAQLQRLENTLRQPSASTSGLTAIPDADQLKKLSSQLQSIVADQLEGRSSLDSARKSGLTIGDPDQLFVSVYLTAAARDPSTALTDAGFQITIADLESGIVEGYAAPRTLLVLVGLPSVRSIEEVYRGRTDAGSVQSQGDAPMRAPLVRAAGVTGEGVKVGIISDSIDQVSPGVNGSRTLGDLPPSVTILQDGPGGSDDEGRAMAEIVYDTAPGISGIWFSTGVISPLTKKASIEALVLAGVDVIADDIYWLGEPFFQDGQVALAADAAVAAGVVYVASAGNRARRSYESAFRTSANGFHDFDPSGGVDQLQDLVVVPASGSLYLVLQWDDPWGSATHDFDVFGYVLDVDPANPAFVFETDNLASGRPVESVSWPNPFSVPVVVSIAIRRSAGTGPSFLKYIVADPNDDDVPIEYATASDTINPDAASASGAITVAAKGYNTPASVENFSSRGYKTRIFDGNGRRLPSPLVLVKPEITGPDCVATSGTFAGGFGYGGGAFCGTSAAVPGVAAVAALVRSVEPDLAPAQIKAALAATAIDIDAPGSPDPQSGYGFVDAVAALAEVAPPPTQGALENPGPSSFQSGIGLISGWVCSANRVTYRIDNGAEKDAAYGTSRNDTTSICGDSDNGFGALINWNVLGDGNHTIRAYADGVEFGSATFNVTTLGVAFLQGASGQYLLSNFPFNGESVMLRWQEGSQNFVISDASFDNAAEIEQVVTQGAVKGALENPGGGSFQSGIGVISGWVCSAGQITLTIDGGAPFPAAYGTSRTDTASSCGDANNGFGRLINWNLLGSGSHTVRAFADGIQFGEATFTVTTLGATFLTGAGGQYLLPDFAGKDVTVRWQEGQQNFVIVGRN